MDSKDITLVDIIKLMDAFAVPYKTMVLRLYETAVIVKDYANELLQVPDRDPKKGILHLINKTGHAKRWQHSTKEEEYSSLVDLAVENYDNFMISLERLSSTLSYIDRDAREFIEESDEEGN
jgi:hypothetical protein